MLFIYCFVYILPYGKFFIGISWFDWLRSEDGPLEWLQFVEYAISSLFALSIYVKSKKIASIALRFSKGFSYHGISINVDMDLQPFISINPCGYQGLEVTQIKDFYSNITLEKVKLVVQDQINKSFS